MTDQTPEASAVEAVDHEARMRGVSTAQFRIASDFIDAILRDVFQGRKDHLRGQMLDIAAKVSRRHPWPYFDQCVEAEVNARLAAGYLSPEQAASEDRAAMSIDPEPPGVALRPFTPSEAEALDLSDYAEDYIAQDHAEKDAPWVPFTCACGGEFKTTLTHALCPECGTVTYVTPPAPTHADEEGEG